MHVLPTNTEMFTERSCVFETSIAESLRLNELNRKESGTSWERQASGWSSFSHCGTESPNNTPEMRTFRQSFPIILDRSHTVSPSFFLSFFLSFSLSFPLFRRLNWTIALGSLYIYIYIYIYTHTHLHIRGRRFRVKQLECSRVVLK